MKKKDDKKDNPIIPLSFKNTPDDMKLYKWILTHSNKSGFIKDILKQTMERELNNK